MPENSFLHSMCVLDDGRKVFIAGGRLHHSWMLDVESGKWDKFVGPKRDTHGTMCGVAKGSDGKEEVVLAGGIRGEEWPLNDVGVFSPSSGLWRKGEGRKGAI